MEKKVGSVLVKTFMGDITDLSVDAIANAANSDLWMGSGVAGAIKAKGGRQIEDEALSMGPIKPGQAVMTTAGALPSKYVIHCAGMPPGGRATHWNVLSSVQSALKIASDNNLASLAFPAIGAGVGGLSKEQSAKAIVEGIYLFSRNSGSVKEITLVGLNKDVSDCFYKAIKEYEE
ncbi:MAG: macro domain-containing protein [Candidatus Thorarchaeota archaeon]